MRKATTMNGKQAKNELYELRKSIALRKQLKEFIDSANPIPDDDYKKHRFYHIWDDYMVSATKAHDRAKQASKRQDNWAAYWNALHAMAAYAAAFAVLDHDDEQTAYADAIRAYHESMTDFRVEVSELDEAFAKRSSQK